MRRSSRWDFEAGGEAEGSRRIASRKIEPKEVPAPLEDAVEVSAVNTEGVGKVFIVVVEREATDREGNKKYTNLSSDELVKVECWWGVVFLECWR